MKYTRFTGFQIRYLKHFEIKWRFIVLSTLKWNLFLNHLWMWGEVETHCNWSYQARIELERGSPAGVRLNKCVDWAIRVVTMTPTITVTAVSAGRPQFRWWHLVIFVLDRAHQRRDRYRPIVRCAPLLFCSRWVGRRRAACQNQQLNRILLDRNMSHFSGRVILSSTQRFSLGEKKQESKALFFISVIIIKLPAVEERQLFRVYCSNDVNISD